MNKVCPCGRVYKGSRCRRCHPEKKKNVSYPSAWKALSERYRAQNPLCEICFEKGITSPSEEVHHKKTIQDRPDLILEKSNLQALCKSCHRQIHKKTPS